MLRHHAYFEFLGSLEDNSPTFAATLAGLAVLTLVDAAREDHSIIDRDWTGVKAAADAVSAIKEGNPLRRPLMKVLDELKGAGPDWTALNMDEALPRKSR